MSFAPSKADLLAALLAEDASRISLYLSRLPNADQPLFKALNDALSESLADPRHKHGPRAALAGLLLYRDIFLSAQFDLIDALHPKIEERILSMALFNHSLQHASRGLSYFCEVSRLSPTPES